MKKIAVTLIASALLFSTCGTDENGSNGKDSLSKRDSIKKEITESLPPSEDFRQFEWIYSSFVAAATYNVKSTDVFIDKEEGLWVITTNGVLPQMLHVKSVRGILNYKNDTLVPINRDNMVCPLLNEEIAKPDCNQRSLWSKNGCFTSEHNTFKEERVWEHAGLTDNDSKNVEALASEIDRVVVNTKLNMRMYFMLKNGSWYLVFLDLRMPCSA